MRNEDTQLNYARRYGSEWRKYALTLEAENRALRRALRVFERVASELEFKLSELELDRVEMIMRMPANAFRRLREMGLL